MWATLAIWGYWGSTRCVRFPSATPCETRNFCGVATLGGGALEPTMLPITPPNWPPGTPPATPPTTPDEGAGWSSSLIILMILGILLGVRSSLFTTSVVRGTCFTTAAAGGGGGGGGGGGATRNELSWCSGNASVINNGSRIIKPIMTSSTMNEIVVVVFWLVRIFPPDSIKLSSTSLLSNPRGTLQ